MEDAVDKDGVGRAVGEANAEIANAEAVFRRIDSLELLDVAGVRLEEALESGGDAEAGGAVQGVQVGLGQAAEDELLQWPSLPLISGSV